MRSVIVLGLFVATAAAASLGYNYGPTVSETDVSPVIVAPTKSSQGLSVVQTKSGAIVNKEGLADAGKLVGTNEIFKTEDIGGASALGSANNIIVSGPLSDTEKDSSASTPVTVVKATETIIKGSNSLNGLGLVGSNQIGSGEVVGVKNLVTTSNVIPLVEANKIVSTVGFDSPSAQLVTGGVSGVGKLQIANNVVVTERFGEAGLIRSSNSGLLGSSGKLIGTTGILGSSGLVDSGGLTGSSGLIGGSRLLGSSELISNGGIVNRAGNTIVLDSSALDSIPQTVEYSKQFFHFSAPEEEQQQSTVQQQLSNVLKKDLQVVFIKAPENNAATNAAIQLAKQAIEQKTAIYVLSKQNDPAQVIAKFQQIQENVPSTPEVRFIKYRTPADAEVAKAQIQAQYDKIGGISENYNGGVAPVLNYASSGPVSVGSTTLLSGGGSIIKTTGGPIVNNVITGSVPLKQSVIISNAKPEAYLPPPL